jgi:hypothetical protein
LNNNNGYDKIKVAKPLDIEVKKPRICGRQIMRDNVEAESPENYFRKSVSQRVQMNFIFNDNVRILCLSYNVKKVGKLVRFKQKGQKITLLPFFIEMLQYDWL